MILERFVPGHFYFCDFTGVVFHVGLMNILLHCGASPLHPMVLMKYAGFVCRLWSCLANVVAHDCPHTRQCVLMWGSTRIKNIQVLVE